MSVLFLLSSKYALSVQQVFTRCHIVWYCRLILWIFCYFGSFVYPFLQLHNWKAFLSTATKLYIPNFKRITIIVTIMLLKGINHLLVLITKADVFLVISRLDVHYADSWISVPVCWSSLALRTELWSDVPCGWGHHGWHRDLAQQLSRLNIPLHYDDSQYW